MAAESTHGPPGMRACLGTASMIVGSALVLGFALTSAASFTVWPLEPPSGAGCVRGSRWGRAASVKIFLSSLFFGLKPNLTRKK